MAWIDLFLNDGDPHKVFGADAETAMRRLPRWRDLPWMAKVYLNSGVGWYTAIRFVMLDMVRYCAYRRGFQDGEVFPWPE